MYYGSDWEYKTTLTKLQTFHQQLSGKTGSVTLFDKYAVIDNKQVQISSNTR